MSYVRSFFLGYTKRSTARSFSSTAMAGKLGNQAALPPIDFQEASDWPKLLAYLTGSCKQYTFSKAFIWLYESIIADLWSSLIIVDHLWWWWITSCLPHMSPWCFLYILFHRPSNMHGSFRVGSPVPQLSTVPWLSTWTHDLGQT